MQDRLGIAIVTYNSDSTLASCLKSVVTHCPHAVVAIAENSGQVDSMRQVAAQYSKLDATVLDPGSNVGFARGVNLAVARLTSRGCTQLLILNPDVELLADPLILVPYLAQADVVGGVLVGAGVDPTGSAGMLRPSNAKRAVTWFSSFLQAALGTRFIGVGTVKEGVLQPVPQIDGAYLLQTMDYYSKNPLDEQFELYFEDVEYCDRARSERGVALFGRVVGRHSAGASYRSSGGTAYLANRVSRARYLRRKYPNLPRNVLRMPFALEVCTRSVTRQPESLAVRVKSFQLASAELLHPGSVRVLGDRRDTVQGQGAGAP